MNCKLSVGVVVLAGLFSANVAAQTQVTPNVQPPITGTQTTVNNGPGDHSDPHINGNLVSYSNSDGTNFTMRYHDLVTAADQGVPNQDAAKCGHCEDGRSCVLRILYGPPRPRFAHSRKSENQASKRAVSLNTACVSRFGRF
jgi:hypothetical protein